MQCVCDWCGSIFYRAPSQIKGKKYLFCSRSCLGSFSSKTKNPDGYADLKDLSAVSAHMTALNREMNPRRMTQETREKVRKARLSPSCKGYRKLYGRHEHRTIAEKKIGRPLKVGEVVHHIDLNLLNNDPSNLMVFPSQAEHAKYHATLRRNEGLYSEIGGDAQ